MSFFDRLRAASVARDSMLCVGLDPTLDTLDEAVERAVAVVAATQDIACCFKPNAGFWEQYGPDGYRGLAQVLTAIPSEVPVLFDAKRGDFGPTMAAYARGIFGALDMDAVTVSAYQGTDSLAEFVRYADRGVYVLCHTSNPGRTDLQHLPTPNEPLYLRVARFAASLNANGNIGLVIGATAPEEAAIVRAVLPDIPFLMPGVGRQGADVGAAVRAAYNGDPASALIGVASAIFDADDPAAAATSWRDRIRESKVHP